MAEFIYDGRRSGGELVSGSVEAPDRDSVPALLESRGITAFNIRAGESAVSAGFDLQKLLARKQRVTADELIMLSRQMSSLTNAGVPLNRAFAALGASVRNLNLRQVLSEVELRVFDEVIKAQGCNGCSSHLL